MSNSSRARLIHILSTPKYSDDFAGVYHFTPEEQVDLILSEFNIVERSQMPQSATRQIRAVVCGSHDQYAIWIDRDADGGKNSFMVGDRRSLAGYLPDDLIFVYFGTYWDNKEAVEAVEWFDSGPWCLNVQLEMVDGKLEEVPV